MYSTLILCQLTLAHCIAYFAFSSLLFRQHHINLHLKQKVSNTQKRILQRQHLLSSSFNDRLKIQPCQISKRSDYVESDQPLIPHAAETNHRDSATHFWQSVLVLCLKHDKNYWIQTITSATCCLSALSSGWFISVHSHWTN